MQQTLEKPWLIGFRLYQLDLRREIIKAWREGAQRILVQLCTGGGKSMIIRSFQLELWLKGKKVLLVCQDTGILTQLLSHAIESGIPQDQVGVLKAWKSGEYPLELHKPMQIAMVQSLTNNWEELTSGPHPLAPDLILIDECHHCDSQNNYFQLWEQFPEAKILGLSATPARPNGHGFYYPEEEGQDRKYLFDRLILGVPKRSLIDQGFLPECGTYFALTPSLRGVAKKRGEFRVTGANGLESRYNNATIRGDVIRAWREFVYDRFGAAPTMCYGVSVAHIKDIAADFRANNIPAVALHGKMGRGEQAKVLKSFIAREAVILCLCGMGQEGFDLATLAKSMGLEAENVFCVIKALATTSLVKNSQLDGRIRGIDLMRWNWRQLPEKIEVIETDQPINQPQATDAVLGGSRSPVHGAMVLGGMAGVESLLRSKDIGGRVAGIKKVLAMSKLDLLEPFLVPGNEDPSPQVQALVETILDHKGLASVGKLLYGVIIDCGNNFVRHEVYDAEHEWSLEGVTVRPLNSKQCPECSLVGLKANLSKCPNCGHVFSKEKVEENSQTPAGEGATISQDKECQMALLDKEAWRSWKELMKQQSSNYVALTEFIMSGAPIPEIARAGRQCKTREGKTYKKYAIYSLWLGCQRKIHGVLWLPTLEALEEWCNVFGYRRETASAWMTECEEYVTKKKTPLLF
jgi:rubredoxin